MVLTGIPFIDCIILFHMIFFSYFANNPAWISGSQTIWRNIPCHNTSCSYYTSLSYGNTTTNNHIGCQPAIIFYSNWRESERKKLWETNSRRSEIYKESISFLIWHLKDSQCPGLSAQSAFLGQVLTHSMHKIHSVPFFRFLELSIISTFIGQTFSHFPHEIHFSLSHLTLTTEK